MPALAGKGGMRPESVHRGEEESAACTYLWDMIWAAESFTVRRPIYAEKNGGELHKMSSGS